MLETFPGGEMMKIESEAVLWNLISNVTVETIEKPDRDGRVT